jgi:hypothetical protein
VTTREALESITDASLFERIAAAVLREAEPERYGSISETGTNASGKTVRSPVDGIAFVTFNSSRTMVLVAHASGALEKLEGKWFHESVEIAAVNEDVGTTRERTPRKQKSVDKGDLVKAREIIERERANNPNLAVTIAVTTNREPSIELRSKVEQFAFTHNIAIDIWSGSRIANILDCSPNGQWIRKTLLGIEADRVSLPLLNALGKRSLQDAPSYRATPSAIDREFDETLQHAIGSQSLFVIGDSGNGKSVACQKLLGRHLDEGQLAFVINDQLLLGSVAIEDAIDAELRRLHPTIEKGAGRRALELATESEPVLLLVEDVNRSSEPAKLIDRLVAWGNKQTTDGKHKAKTWQIVCPLWPQSISKALDSSQKYVHANAVHSTTFTKKEATQVLVLNAHARGHSVSEIEASSAADALGYDPLLIDLFEWEADSNPQSVVADYVTRALKRLSETSTQTTVNEYRAGLNEIGRYLLSNRLRSARWSDFCAFMEQRIDVITRVREILKDRKVGQLVLNSVGDETIVFRHNQVEFHVLAQCVFELHQENALNSHLLADPYYAHVFGQALLFEPFNPALASRLYDLNPLALFHAICKYRGTPSKSQQSILELGKKWLRQPTSQGREYRRLRYAILWQFRHLHDPIAVELLSLIPDPSWINDEVRFLNGDVRAGIRICASAGAGVGHPQRDRLVAHALEHYRAALVREVDNVLRDSSAHPDYKVGAIRLAGFIASAQLLDSLTTSWQAETEKRELLPDYIFAAMHCSGEHHSLLIPLCDFWESLPDAPRGNIYSERDEILAHDLKFACRRGLPETSLRFFVSRAETSSLKEQIETLLGVVDHPLAVESTVKSRATRRRAAKERGETWFWSNLSNEWSAGFGQQRKMSQSSKQALEAIWTNDEHDLFLKREAFGLWSAAAQSADLTKLRAFVADAAISDDVLRTRLKLRDVSAIDQFIEKLHAVTNWHWWQHVRGLHHPKLVAAIDGQLERSRSTVGQEAKSSNTHWMLSQVLIRLERNDAATLLTKHWDHLKDVPYFVHAALYVAKPETLSLAAESINISASPKELLAHIHMHFGVKETDHPGVHDIAQLEALIPYMGRLDDLCVYMFWELCNEREWCEFRKKHLDSRLSAQWRKSAAIDSADVDHSLDAMVASKHFDATYHWAERQIEKYATTRELLHKVVDWSKRRGTIDSLEITARVFEETASRADLDLIEPLRFDPASESDEIIQDVKSSVSMRSLI